MGLFGGGQKMDSATKAYNAALRDYSTWQMGVNKDIANEAKQYVGLTPANDIAYDTMSGQYLNANPYINQVAGNVAQQVVDRYNKSYIPSALSSYAGSGRFGSGLFQRTLADTQSQMNQDVANAMSNVYYQNYSAERALQENARARAASQYDPLNRYSAYSGITNAYTAAQPQATYKSGTNWGQMLGMAGGALAGGLIAGPSGAVAGASVGGSMGGML